MADFIVRFIVLTMFALYVLETRKDFKRKQIFAFHIDLLVLILTGIYLSIV